MYFLAYSSDLNITFWVLVEWAGNLLDLVYHAFDPVPLYIMRRSDSTYSSSTQKEYDKADGAEQYDRRVVSA